MENGGSTAKTDNPTHATAGPGQFKDWAHGATQEYLGHAPSWTRGDYVSLAKAWELAGSEARSAFAAFLRNTDTYFASKKPTKFLQELDRFRRDARALQDDGRPSAGPVDPRTLETRAAKAGAREKARQQAERIRAAAVSFLDGKPRG